MLDFINFKETLAPKHYELVENFGISSHGFDEAREELESALKKKEELEITKQTNVRLIEELTAETTRIKDETEERGHELAKKRLELKLNTEKKQEISDMVKLKTTEVNKVKEEIEAQKSLVIYEDPLELENERECTKQAKLQKIQELSKHKEELA